MRSISSRASEVGSERLASPQSAFGRGAPSVAKVALDEAWADRDLVIVTRRGATLSQAAGALVDHLVACGSRSARAKRARGTRRS